jgi:hypothetical protein
MAVAVELFFLLSMFTCVCGTGFHRGFWFWKILLTLGGCVGFMFIPPESFDIVAYIWTARVLSMVFVIIQLFLILAFAYDWNDQWVDNAFTEGNNKNCWLAAVLTCSLFLYIVAFAGIVLLYIGYECSFANTITSITLIVVVLFTAVALFREKLTGGEGAILPAAVSASYPVYLAWSALESNPNDSCKPFRANTEGGGGVMAVGIFIAALSMMWLANTSASSAKSLVNGGHGHVDEQGAGEKSQPELIYTVSDDGRTGQDVRREQQGGYEEASEAPAQGNHERLQTAAFYFVLIVTTMYMSMVVTDWGQTEVQAATSTGQMWVKVISQWITFILFLWTLLAPRFLTDRDFSNEGSQGGRTKPRSSRGSTIEMSENKQQRRRRSSSSGGARQETSLANV